MDLYNLALHATESNVITPSILGARFTMNPVLILIAGLLG